MVAFLLATIRQQKSQLGSLALMQQIHSKTQTICQSFSSVVPHVFDGDTTEMGQADERDKKFKMIRQSEAEQYICNIVHIDDLPVHNGDEMIDADTWQWQGDSIAKARYEEFLPYPIYSHSHPAVNINASYGFNEYTKRGVHGRYVKINDRNNDVRMLIIDNDDPNYYSWKGRLPEVNLTIISPLTLRSHLVYFLSEEVNRNDHRFKSLRKRMAQRLGGNVDDKNAGQWFRSPFFLKGQKDWSLLKDGVLQPDCHYVLTNEHTWTKTYSLDELERYLKPPCLNDIFNNETVLGSEPSFQPPQPHIVPIVVQTVIPPNKLGTLPKSVRGASGYPFMWESGLKNAIRCYDPCLHVETVKTAMRAEFEAFGQGVKAYKIKEAVRCAYEFAEKTYDETKRRKPDYDHSPERQREVANARYDKLRDIIGLLEVDKIEMSGKSERTYYRHKKNGPPVKKEKPWIALGVGKTTYYKNLKKATPEAPEAISVPEATFVPETVESQPVTICDGPDGIVWDWDHQIEFEPAPIQAQPLIPNNDDLYITLIREQRQRTLVETG
jgi:hypothetical protein